MLLVFVLLFNVLLMSACQMTPPDGGETVVPPADKPVDGPEGGDPDEEDPDDPEAPVVPEPSQPLTPFGQKIEKAIDEALAKIDFCKTSYGGKFPGAYSKNYVYGTSGNTAGWVQGFWVGTLWHAYELADTTKARNSYSYLASTLIGTFAERIDKKLGVDNHDMGFLYSPSCVAAYRLTNNQVAAEAAIKAADNLLTRYHADAGFIQAWGTMGDEAEYRLIVDCLMNLPLLYWASEETGDAKYKDAADKHLAATFKTVYREDGTTYHTYYFDPETKQPTKGVTKQGYADESTWSRGQAWAIYGPALAYSYNGDETALGYFKKAANFFIDNLPTSGIPYWDFDFKDGDGEPKDSSAAAIAVCGLLEGCKYLDDSDPDKAKYMSAAEKMMEALIDTCAATQKPDANGLLLYVTQSRRTENSVEQMTPYGDYFYMEALHRFSDPEWTPYW